MEEALRAHLAAAAPLAALIGARLQWGVRDPVSPSVALHLISAPPDWHLKGPSGLVTARVQADSWATTYLGAKAVAEALKAALPTIGQVIGDVKFLAVQVLDEERGQFGAQPNILFRTRTDIRVSINQA